MRLKRNLALACVLLLALPLSIAAAETTFNGTVVAGETLCVTAPFGGLVAASPLRVGDELAEGDLIATIQTTKVYAPTDGVITGVFGQPGDTVSDVASRMGAVLYIAPTSQYSITADIQYAYNNSDNKYVHTGETVYIHSYSSSYDHDAVGTITAASGTTYTVESTEGALLIGETVQIYRDPDYTASSRIGRGTVGRTAELAVGGSSESTGGSGSTGSSGSSEASLLALHVQDGDAVTRGQLLYETVTGPLDGLYAAGNQIVSELDGVVASVSVSTGKTIAKGDTLLTLYPRDHMQIELEIDEYDLTDIHEGDRLSLAFNYDDSGASDTVGTVAMISHVSAGTDDSDATYKAYVDFTPADAVRLGMGVTATPLDEGGEAATQPEPAEMTEEAVGE